MSKRMTLVAPDKNRIEVLLAKIQSVPRMFPSGRKEYLVGICSLVGADTTLLQEVAKMTGSTGI